MERPQILMKFWLKAVLQISNFKGQLHWLVSPFLKSHYILIFKLVPKATSFRKIENDILSRLEGVASWELSRLHEFTAEILVYD